MSLWASRSNSLQPLQMLCAELGDLRCDDRAAVPLPRIAPEVILMVLLGGVERGERSHCGDDRGVEHTVALDFRDHLARHPLLLRAVIVDRRAVLGADVGALTIER